MDIDPRAYGRRPIDVFVEFGDDERGLVCAESDLGNAKKRLRLRRGVGSGDFGAVREERLDRRGATCVDVEDREVKTAVGGEQ